MTEKVKITACVTITLCVVPLVIEIPAGLSELGRERAISAVVLARDYDMNIAAAINDGELDSIEVVDWEFVV
jgi:hypothetical protein